MQLTPKTTVLDIGCGTGLLATQFIKHEIPYIGIDFDRSRIEYAKSKFPQCTFICGDLNALNSFNLIEKELLYPLLHGVIHHLSNQEAIDLFRYLKNIMKCTIVGIMDPILPSSFISNPIGFTLAKMDQGKFVRTLTEYNQLLGSLGYHEFEIVKHKQWPVPVCFSTVRFTK